jgi:hypothetical protein
MKKFLLALCLSLVLALGCVGTLPTTAEPVAIKQPAYIERIVKIINNMEGPPIAIIDYRCDDNTLWLWIDNLGMPGDCDYVVILGILDMDNDGYEGLARIDKQNADDPCALGYTEYEEYLRIIEVNKQQPKQGI